MRNKILKLLENDALLTTSQIGTMLGINEEEVAKEIRFCKKEGIIKGTKTLIDWDKTSISDACAIVHLKVTPKFETGFDEIAERIALFDEVDSVTLIAGSADLEIVVTGKSIQEISMFVSRKLSTLSSVISTKTQFILKKYKDRGIILGDDSEHDSRSILS